MLLADLGATVIKVEPPGGDPTRGFPPHFVDGDSAYFHSLNRNKRSVVLDLATDAGRRDLYELVAKADVVVDNFRPGVLKKLGSDYEALRRIRPDIISCSITGFGSGGPRSEEPAYDLSIQAYAGAMSITGHVGGPPTRLGIPVGDLAGAMYAVVGILAALSHRERSGEGQRVEISLLAALASLHTYQLTYFLLSGESPTPLGTGHTSIVPFRAFASADGYICVMAPTEKFWLALCEVIKPELADDRRFGSATERLAHRADLEQLLENIFRGRTTAAWLADLAKAGVPAAPVNSIAAAAAEPEIAKLLTAAWRGTARVPIVMNPIEFSGSPLSTYEAPPRQGEHQMILGKDASTVVAD
jgi:CoA:oxalate CoA-transferase